jgi:hypothetical protein
MADVTAILAESALKGKVGDLIVFVVALVV